MTHGEFNGHEGKRDDILIGSDKVEGERMASDHKVYDYYKVSLWYTD